MNSFVLRIGVEVVDCSILVGVAVEDFVDIAVVVVEHIVVELAVVGWVQDFVAVVEHIVEKAVD